MTFRGLLGFFDALWLTLLAWAIVFAVVRAWTNFSHTGLRIWAFVVFAILFTALVRALRFLKQPPRLALAFAIFPLASIAIIALVLFVSVTI